MTASASIKTGSRGSHAPGGSAPESKEVGITGLTVRPIGGSSCSLASPPLS